MQLITDEYRKLNELKHNQSRDYGTSGHLYCEEVLGLCGRLNTTDVLDYGCGKNTLANTLPFEIKKYDPAIRAFHEDPEPADILVCTDVLEHIEPECLDAVLDHMKSKIKKIGFLVIHCGPANKHLDDGRNAHLIIYQYDKWFEIIAKKFTVLDMKKHGVVLVMVVAPEEKLVLPNQNPEVNKLKEVEEYEVTAN